MAGYTCPALVACDSAYHDKPITVKVHIELHGVPVGVKTFGGLLEFITRELTVSCLPLDIPKKFEVDVTLLEIGGAVRAGSIPMPPNVRLLTDGDHLLAQVVAKHAEEVVEAAPDAAVAVAAEPEVARRGKAPAEGEAAPAAPAGKDVKKDKK